ncbi:PREDICTED: pectinesterase inhibitor-like [Tarenaya hassleriana]|uniref:pectinesterase inhibitor-like n=1 Tax=Tarenaya hassleriana TaxID=28532 RepID=UPI00053CA0A7|nr:PREDICTED: pectinesterase inhibitor-like [Tarenaya hassleriana]
MMKMRSQYCVAVVAMFLQISTAISEPAMAPAGPNLIQQVCSHTSFPKLCVSSLSSDPSNVASNLQGLASISIGVVSKKANETMQYLVEEIAKIRERGDFERYGSCIEEYAAVIDRFLPAASAHLKAQRYSDAITVMIDVSKSSQHCEEQFAGKSPLSERDLTVHDLAVNSADVIKVLASP